MFKLFASSGREITRLGKIVAANSSIMVTMEKHEQTKTRARAVHDRMIHSTT